MTTNSILLIYVEQFLCYVGNQRFRDKIKNQITLTNNVNTTKALVLVFSNIDPYNSHIKWESKAIFSQLGNVMRMLH